MDWLTLFGFGALVYLYGGYTLVLSLLAYLQKTAVTVANDEHLLPLVTVLITVFNEAKGIESRIQNVLDCEYPADRLEILVASDGSNDGTDDLVTAIADKRVCLFRPIDRRGKTDTQNQAIALATGEIVIFTDAETSFDTQFIKELVQPFSDPVVGGVDGHLLFITDPASGVSQSQGFYWRQELQIRTLESRLGILAVASGACMAVRRSIFRPMLATVGEDCLIPLDVVDQGYKMIHATKALAFDKMEHETSKEFRTRVRMTLRNWQGTWSYPQLLNPLKNYNIAWALWSHKVLRWLSPFFLLLWCLGSIALISAFESQSFLGIPGAVFILATFAGALKLPLPGAAVAYSFCLANVGFMVGVIKAIAGTKVVAYK